MLDQWLDGYLKSECLKYMANNYNRCKITNRIISFYKNSRIVNDKNRS